jgi:acetyl esterase/lipase
MVQRISIFLYLLMILFPGTNFAQVSWTELNQLPLPTANKTITYGESEHQVMDVFLPKDVPVKSNVMLIHGGCWQNQYDRLYMGHMAKSLSDRGYRVFNIEYRRTGDQGGGYPGTLDDIQSAYKKIQTYLTEDQESNININVMGHSAGGHLSLWLAATEPSVSAVIGLAAISDLSSYAEGSGSCNIAALSFMGASPTEQADHYKKADPLLMETPKAKVTLISTEKDGIVPPSHNDAYTQKSGAEHHIIAEMGHFDLVAPTSVIWLSLLDIIEKALR